MKVKLVLVGSVNGKITRGTDPNIYSWTSKEDQDHFFSLIHQARVIVMGRKTYEGAKSKIKLVPGKLRVVMTRDPQQYQAVVVPGQLEFSDETAEQLTQRLSILGYEEVLLVGGSSTASVFFDAKLIDELEYTIEPVVFNEGMQFCQALDETVSLQIVEVKKLNEKGTVLFKYRIEK